MRKSVLILSTIVLIGCNTQTPTDTPETTPAVAKSESKDIHTEAVKDAKKAVESAEKAVKDAKKAVEVLEKVEKTDAKKVVAVEKKEEVVIDSNKTETNATVAVVDGAEIFTKCSACHGEDGKKSAFQKSEIIAGQNVEALITSITEYKAGTRDVSGMGKLMKGQVAELSEDEIKAVSEYISTL